MQMHRYSATEDDSGAAPKETRLGRSEQGVVEKIEAAISFFWAACVMISVVSIGGVALLILWIEGDWVFLPRIPFDDWGTLVVACSILWLIAAPIEFFCLRWANKGMNANPTLIDLALRQPRWPIWVGAVVTAWWIMHYGLSIYVAGGLAAHYRHEMDKNRNPWLLMGFLSLAVPLVAAIASNFFLVLASAALFPSRSVVSMIWRLRYPIDLAAAMVPFIAFGQRKA